jgi:D-alanyl-lipoteichoic acid acyltransferase DltB (MBOAT superfamily)
MQIEIDNTSCINPLKTNGNYMYQLLWKLVTLHFVFMGTVCFKFNKWLFFNSVFQLIFIMVVMQCRVLFDVRIELLNNI